MYACLLYYRPLVVDATQSRLKGFLMKVKRYVIPFDKRELAMRAICGCHAVLMMDILIVLFAYCQIFVCLFPSLELWQPW